MSTMKFLTLDVGGTYAVTPSYVNNPQDFTCQLVAHNIQINELTRVLTQVHEYLKPDEGNIPLDYLSPGSVGCVKLKDGRWYRAVLTSVTHNNIIQVKLLDFGTIQDVHVSQLKQISKQEYVDVPIQGLEFKLWNVNPMGVQWSESENHFFRNLVMGKEFVVKVMSVTAERRFEVSMLDYDRLEVNRHFRGNSGQPTANTAVSPPPGVVQRPPTSGNPQRIARGQALVSGLTQRSQQLPSNNLSPNANLVVLKNQFLKVGSSVVITLAAVHKLSDVICHVTQNIQALNALMGDIDQFYSSLMPNDLALGGVVPGLACCARFTDNNNWYRAEIISVQGRGIEVEYADYGNREVLPISRLKTLSTAFTSLPKQGIHCSLVDETQSLNLSKDALQKMQQHINRNLSAHILREIHPGKYFITLLDNIGQNILSQCVIPTNDATQTSPTIPVIKVGQKFLVEVSNVESVCKFTCQLKSSSVDLNTMMDKIHDYYIAKGNTMTLTNASKGMPCCCQFTEDDGWYRAEIINVNVNEAEVKYIDYGNTEKLPLSRIKDLQTEFMALPMQSIDCCLDSSLSGIQLDLRMFESLIHNKTLSAVLLKIEADGRFCIKLHDGTIDIGLELMKSQSSQQKLTKGRTTSANLASSQQHSKFFFPKSTLQFGVEQNVYVSHVDNPESFYVQLSNFAGQMDTMVDAIHEYYSKLGPDEENCSPELGMACVAKYTADDGWYRATVTGLYHNGDVQVLFVDYGNVEVLKKSALKVLNKDFMLLPSQGIKCALVGIQSGGQEWSADIMYGFEELVLNKELAINALQYNNESDLYHVQLFDSDRSNLSLKLFKMAGSGAAEVTTNPFDVITFTKGQYENVMISHSDDPGNFWCHISEKIPEIDALMDDLFEEYDGGNVGNLGSNAKAGMSCCAKYSDGSWYRAKILKIKGQDATIQYVDYGNTSSTDISELKPLLPKFANLPEQAIACSLVDIAPIGASWSEESCSSFNQMVIDKKLVLHVICQEESGRSLVELVNTQEDCVINESLVNKGLVKSTKSSYSSKSSRSSSRISSSKGRQVTRINSQDNLSNSGSTTSLPSLSMLGFKDSSYLPGCKLSVYISHACSPAEFWCQSIETAGMLEELMNNIDQHYSKLGRSEQGLDVTTVGTPCIAKYKADDGWYRGIIVNKHMGSLEINFVDYGNTEHVSITDVKQILPEFLELPIQGLKCVLKGMEVNGKSPKMIKLFSDVASGVEEFTCNILTESSGVYEVDLEWSGKKMSSELVSSKKERSSSYRSNNSDDVFGTPPRKEKQRYSQSRKDEVDGGGFSKPSNKTNNMGRHDKGDSGGFNSKPKNEPSLSYAIDSIRVGGYEDFLVSHIENPSQFWCQPAKSCTELDKLMESINQNEHAAVDFIKPGSPCIARFKDDDGWYRALVKKQLQSSKFEIQFVDYGNSDTVSKADLKILTSDFASLPAQAIECRMKGLQKGTETLTDEFEALVAEKQLVAQISKKTEKIVEIRLVDTSDGKDIVISDVLNSKAAAKPMKFTPLNIKAGGKEDIYITSTDNGGVVYAQFGSQAVLLEEIQNKLASYYTDGNTDSLTNFSLNQQCCALFSEDGLWYRAIIEGYGESDAVLVRYIDFGNVETQKKLSLKKLIQGVADVPPLAVKCVINVDNVNRWNEDTNRKFSEMVTDKLLQAEFKSDTKPYSVKLVLDGSDVGELFRSQAVEIPPDVPLKFKSNHSLLKDKVEVYVSHTLSLDKFWCQPVSSADDLAALMDSVHKLYSTLTDEDRCVQEVTIGTPCIAKFAEDDGWYRGIINGSCDEGVNVMYVDYGNSAVVSITDIRTISSEFISLPPQAVLCQLKGGNNWKDGAVEKFEEETLDKKLLIEMVEKRRVEGEIVSRVKLLDMGMSILQKLLESELGEAVSEDIESTLQYESSVNLVEENEKLEVFVSSVTSLDDFSIQLNKTANDLALLMDTIFEIYTTDGTENTPHSIGPCMAKYAEDGGWYRGEVTEVSVETGLVFFIDYGNSEPVPWTDIKTSCVEAMELPAQAVKCKLDLPKDIESKKEELLAVFQGAVADKLLTAEFISLTDDVWKVSLSENNQLLIDKLFKSSSTQVEALGSQASKYYKPLSLKEGDRNRVIVTWSESPGSFWCQLESMSADLDILGEQIQTHYTALDEDADVISEQRVGMPCIAPVEDEGVWYRCVITKCDKDQTTVQYVDYGNTGILPKSKIKIIKNSMLSQPIFAFKCTLDSIGPKDGTWSVEACETFEASAFEGALTATVMSSQRDSYFVTLVTDSSVSVNQSLLDSGVAVEKSKDAKQIECVAEKYIKMATPSSPMEIQVSHVETPHKFFVQPTSNAEELEQICAKVLSAVPSASPLDQVIVGDICLAKYSLDEVWYRAVISGTEDKLTFVTFIDYGNTDALQLHDLKQMPDELRSLPAQALECRLSSIAPLSESWEDAASIAFEETVLEQLYDATFSGQSVELLTKEGTPLKDILVKAGICKIADVLKKDQHEKTVESQEPQYLQMPIPVEKIEIQISHVETPHKFFVQPTSKAEELEQICAKVLNAIPSASPLDQVTVGDICLAKYSLDEVWYRAVVNGTEDKLTFVTFIDYGNTDALQFQDLKQMPDELRSLPAQALECKLSSVAPLGQSWEDTASIAFEETVLEQLYDIKFFSGQSVELLTKEGTPLKDILVEAGICKIADVLKKDQHEKTVESKETQYRQMPIPVEKIEIQISHVETPHKFFVQPTSKAEELEQICAKVLNAIPSASPLDQVTVGDICLAKYSLDEVWYRAVISGTEDKLTFVTFIDYGNTDALQLQDLKQMPDELRSLPAQALECKLSSVAPLGPSWEDTASIAFEETVLEQLYDATFSGQSVELLTKDGTPLKDILVGAGICKIEDVLENKKSEVIAESQKPHSTDDSVSLENLTSAVEDDNESLDEIANIAKSVVENVIEGALVYLENELNECPDSNIDVSEETLTEFAQDKEKPPENFSTKEFPTGNISISSAVVEEILDDLVETSLNRSIDVAETVDVGDNSSGDFISNGADNTSDTADGTISTSYNTSDVTDANSNAVFTSNATDTLALKDLSNNISSTVKKTGSVTDEWDVIKTPDGHKPDRDKKIDITHEGMEQELSQDSVDESPPAGSVEEGDGITMDNSGPCELKSQETDDIFLDAVDDEDQLLPDKGGVESDETQEPSILSENNDLENPGSQEVNKPLEGIIVQELVEKVHEE